MTNRQKSRQGRSQDNKKSQDGYCKQKIKINRQIKENCVNHPHQVWINYDGRICKQGFLLKRLRTCGRNLWEEPMGGKMYQASGGSFFVAFRIESI